jgi:TolB-like protein/class 3 adenylate cyclase/lipoprotein NlpI
MTAQDVKRKLTAILSADVEGYSRLMDDDEVGTIRTLNTYKGEMTALIRQYRGRVVDAPGDNLLAEFASVVDAVNCAVEIQRELAERNQELPSDRRMQFRMGVNLGDVVEEEGRIYGDGVNIAARLESMAESGGICISGTVYDHIKNKVELEYEHIGEQTVKNISEPIVVYRVLSYPGAAAHRVIKAKKAVDKKIRHAAFAISAVLVLGVAVLVIWNLYLHPTPTIEPANVNKMAYPLPDKPSIAVLPFDNMSGDPEQEYFSYGLTKDIITALSKVPRLFIIARDSVNTYKGKPVKVQHVAEELGVRYVLKGSVRQSGDQVRITAQLIDATNGLHLWAEKYDRNLEDIFALQDEITNKILTSLQVKLTEGEQARIWRKGTNNIKAYEKYIKGLEHFRRWKKDDNLIARHLWTEAIEIDPQYALAYVAIAYTHSVASSWGWSKTPEESLLKAEELAQKALALDDSLADTYALLGNLAMKNGQYDEAVNFAERAITLNPGQGDVAGLYALYLSAAGRQDEAIAMFKQSIRLNPMSPAWVFQYLGRSYILAGRYEDAIEVLKKIFMRNPDFLGAHIHLAAVYSLAGRDDDARASTAGSLLRVIQNYWVSSMTLTKRS